MDVLARVLGGGSLQASWSPTDDRWYQPINGGSLTAAGVRIDSDGAKKVSAWFRGRDLLATSLAMLPLPSYKRLEDGGRTPVNVTVGDVVGRKPNVWQNAFDWRRQRMYNLIDYGNSYDRIVPGPRGFLDQLWPVHPSLVTPRQINTGRVMYDVREPKTGQITSYTQDDIFHMRANSDDGVCGKGVLDHARDSLGLSLSLENYASTTFSRGGMHGGLISVQGLLDEEASKRMAASFVTSYGNWHMPKVLEQGATWVENTFTPEQAQMLLSRKFSTNDIARWLGVPPHMVGDLDRATFSNIEEQGLEFVTYSLGPWLALFESAINDQLIIQTDTYYVEFVRDALVRGDISKRWQAYQVAVTTGTFTRNEVRELENRNKLPGLDEPLDPAFLKGSNQGGSNNAPKDPATSSTRTKAEMIAEASASRLLRKEITAVQKMAVRFAADQDGFASAVTEFYETHAELVAVTLMMGMDEARDYCSQQAAQIVSGDWIAALGTWKTEDYAAGLAALALEEAA
jgi:HK97 family phage portal protein